ncbi:glycoside hydrolase family 127 protein [Natronosporangium hydrolyticum]|uniref:Glycoside hydrolase family 127 protein n=1 Tax=Natronosporangium hydrolyticum TaxID=2811111 RepID=A0A895YCB0_9ACTN|nr:beta-L-arabinofuranosidase domain-containing protein [Natronosporangium hydrolyticum]QSB13842.1 glycoside hydrolase family 127 protein [Natronosporangium hydrolyticum]
MPEPYPIPAAPAAARAAREPFDVREVRLGRGFLGDWQTRNRQATIPHCIARLETSGVMDNLRRLVGESDAPFRGMLFADSDLFKTLEAVGWEAVRDGAPEFASFVDDAVRLLALVQTDDGYLNSYYQGPRAGERFTDLPHGHELYCLGHLVQAAIAWSCAGRGDLLEIALRYVELVHQIFGPEGRDGVCGHPEIETALVELSRHTGDPRHRELARRMVELRGRSLLGEHGFGAGYFQDLVPVREAREATGHAVRQLYLLAGVTDLQLDDPAAGYGEALAALWGSVHLAKLYVTGGLGSRHRGEAFGDPYELPPDRAYAETCAAIANLQWNWRMLLWRGEARFADELERALYNAIAVATSVDGRSFFYSNPLQLRTGHTHEEDAPSRRLDWYACACCPPNLARLLSSISGYVLTRTEGAVQFQLYAAGEFDLGDGVTARVETAYPWRGDVSITLDRPAVTDIELRIPWWAPGARLVVDGAEVPVPGPGYVTAGAGARRIELTLPVQPAWERAHPWVDAVRGTVAVRRGPVYFAVESADLPPGVSLEDVALTADSRLVDRGWDEQLGVPLLGITDVARRPRPEPLYERAGERGIRDGGDPGEWSPAEVTAVPYCRWGNREPGAMRVWLPTS